jgi:hypothetical protein
MHAFLVQLFYQWSMIVRALMLTVLLISTLHSLGAPYQLDCCTKVGHGRVLVLITIKSFNASLITVVQL